MRYLTLIGASYSFLCLAFLGLRLKNVAATQFFGYVGLIFYLFLKEFCHQACPTVYPFIAMFRGIIFLSPYFLWTSTMSLMGKPIRPGLRSFVVSAVAVLCSFDILYVQRYPAGLAFVSLELLAVVSPVLASVFALREVRRFTSIYQEEIAHRGKGRVFWLNAFVAGNLLLSLLFMSDSVLQLRGLGFGYLGLLVTAFVQFGFILFTTRDSTGFFDEAVLQAVSAASQRRRELLSEDTTNNLSRKIDKLLREEKIYLDPDLDIASVSERMNEKIEVLSKYFQQTRNKSFKDFINHQRIQHCLELLQNGTGKNILEVAFESGFNSKATFYRYFDKYVGCSPKHYLQRSSDTGQG